MLLHSYIDPSSDENENRLPSISIRQNKEMWSELNHEYNEAICQILLKNKIMKSQILSWNNFSWIWIKEKAFDISNELLISCDPKS